MHGALHTRRLLPGSDWTVADFAAVAGMMDGPMHAGVRFAQAHG